MLDILGCALWWHLTLAYDGRYGPRTEQLMKMKYLYCLTVTCAMHEPYASAGARSARVQVPVSAWGWVGRRGHGRGEGANAGLKAKLGRQQGGP